MNLLFEIPDSVLIIIGIIIVLIIAIIAIFLRASSRKVKPIDEEERYDRDEFEITKDDFEEEVSEVDAEEREKARNELEKVFNQMSADLEVEKQKTEIEDIDDFEREQEENAIISYQELLAHAEKLKEEASMYERIAEEKANMEIDEVISKRREERPSDIREKKKAFRSSDIVSPIYGIQSNKNMVRQKRPSRKLSESLAYEQERFEKEETQNLDFLNSLKEFRKNL